MNLTPAAHGAILVLIATIGFASLGTLANVAYESGMRPPTFVALRAALGALVLAGIVISRPNRRIRLRSLTSRDRALLALAIGLNGAFNLALFAAFDAMEVPIALAIYFTYPGLVAVVSVVLGRERFTMTRVVGLTLAVTGAIIIAAERVTGADAVPVGVLLAMAAASCQAAYLVVSRSGFRTMPAEQAIALVLAGGFVMAAGTAAATGSLGGGWHDDLLPWMAVIAAALIGTAAAKVWVLQGVRLLGGTRSAVIMLGEPIGGGLLAAATLGQPLTASWAVGGGLIVLGALAVQRAAPGRRFDVE